MSLKRNSLLTSLVAGALIAPLPPLSHAAAPPSAVCGRPHAPGAPAPDASWAPTSTVFGEAEGYDPYVGNGYLGHRVPATGAGCAATGEKTGWPLYTPRYDGAFVSGLRLRALRPRQGPRRGPRGDRRAACWTTLDVRVGSETYDASTPRGARLAHFYAGLLVAPFLLVAATTGLLYAGSYQAEKVLYADELRVPAGARELPVSQQVDAAREAHPQG